MGCRAAVAVALLCVRAAGQCAPVDFRMRRKLDKERNREHLRRMSCSSRCEKGKSVPTSQHLASSERIDWQT